MLAHCKYLKYVLRHKWFVFLYCLQYGLIWRGIKHDWSKFLPSEWFPYVAYFYGEKVAHPTTKVLRGDSLVPLMETPADVQLAFDVAWNYHQKRNDHHWQYWLLTPDNPRPNFNEQSMDGGMSHSWVATTSYNKEFDAGKIVAVIFDDTVKEPAYPLVKALNRDLDNTPVPLPMPRAARKEMLADWRGAGRALGKPNTWEWYEANKDKMQLHPDTRAWVEAELARLKEYHRRLERFRALGF